MKEEQFEALVGVGKRYSLAVFKCDNDFVLNDILTEGIGGRVDVNADWQDCERTCVDLCEEYGTYKVTGIATISDDREKLDYTTTWERIA
jgi:hypothetical protein